MFLLLLAALFATLNAIVSGYYLVQAVATAEGRQGSIIFSGISGITALFLFIIAAMHA